MKKIFHYLKEDNQERLRSKGNGTIKIVAYCELEWGGDHEKKQSKSDTLMLRNTPLTWNNCKQTTIAQSNANT